jgi:hypothetical protein
MESVQKHLDFLTTRMWHFVRVRIRIRYLFTLMGIWVEGLNFRTYDLPTEQAQRKIVSAWEHRAMLPLTPDQRATIRDFVGFAERVQQKYNQSRTVENDIGRRLIDICFGIELSNFDKYHRQHACWVLNEIGIVPNDDLSLESLVESIRELLPYLQEQKMEKCLDEVEVTLHIYRFSK